MLRYLFLAVLLMFHQDNPEKLCLDGTFIPLEDRTISDLRWLGENLFAVYESYSFVWIYDASELEREPLSFSSRGKFSPDGRYWAVQQEGMTEVFDTATGTLFNTFQHSPSNIRDFDALAFDRASTKLASSRGNVIDIWYITTGELISTIIVEDSFVTSLAFNFDGTLLVAGLYNTVAAVWDVHLTALVAQIDGHMNNIYPRFVSEDDWLLIQSIDRSITLWDIISKKRLIYVSTHSDLSYAYVTDDQQSLVVADSIVRNGVAYGVFQIWDIEQETQKAVYELKAGEALSLVPGNMILSGEQIVISAEDRNLLLIDTVTGVQLYEFVHPEIVKGADFNADGSLIVSWDETLHLWDAYTGNQIIELDTEPIVDAIFTPNGTQLITAHEDGSILLWDITKQCED
jgi:WD40 repeat protein